MIFNLLVFILSLLGLADTAYLTWQHYQIIPGTCSLGGGCSEVTASVYAVFWGMPLAVWGLLYYLAILVVVAFLLFSKDKIWLKILLGLTAAGFLASVIFVYLQAAVIKAFCAYCLVSALITGLIFLSVIIKLWSNKTWEN